MGSGENLRMVVSVDAPDQLPAAVRGAGLPSEPRTGLPRMVFGERAAILERLPQGMRSRGAGAGGTVSPLGSPDVA